MDASPHDRAALSAVIEMTEYLAPDRR